MCECKRGRLTQLRLALPCRRREVAPNEREELLKRGRRAEE